jgi:hypothetical protein
MSSESVEYANFMLNDIVDFSEATLCIDET